MGANFRTWEADSVDGIIAGQNHFKRGKASARTPFNGTGAIAAPTTTLTINTQARQTWRTSSIGNTVTVSQTNVFAGEYNYNFNRVSTQIDGTAYIQSPLFNLNRKLLGKPVIVSFDIEGLTAFGTVDVIAVRYDSSGVWQEDIPIAGTASATTNAKKSAGLPSGRATFNGFFVSGSSSAGDFYALRFRLLSETASVFYADNFIVGTQTSVAGTAITDWQSYIPSTQGFGTLSAQSFFYRRVGDTLELQVRFTSGTATAVLPFIGLPVGLTVSSAASSGGSNVGKWIIARAGANTVKQGSILAAQNDSLVTFSYDDYVLSNSPFTPIASASGEGFGTSTFSLFARVPIAQWSSNITMADRAVEEYVFNTGTVTTAGGSDTSSFGYGAGGTQFYNYDSATLNAVTTLRCRFQTPIQPTDRLVIELLNVNRWVEHADSTILVCVYQFQSNSQYGMSIAPVSGSNTDVDVQFGNAGRNTTGATYGASGQTWLNLSSVPTSYRWRVRKVSGGAQVGYPISARNVVGDTSGTIVPSGYIGEPINGTYLSPSISAAGVQQNHYSISITPGVWRIEGMSGYSVGITGSVVATDNYFVISISPNSGAEQSPLAVSSLPGALSGGGRNTYISRVVTATATATWYLVARHNITTLGTSAVYSEGFLRATRIA